MKLSEGDLYKCISPVASLHGVELKPFTVYQRWPSLSLAIRCLQIPASSDINRSKQFLVKEKCSFHPVLGLSFRLLTLTLNCETISS